MWIIWEGTILRNVVLSRRCLYKPISILSLQFDSMPNIFLRYRSCYAKVPGHDTTKSTVSTSGSTAPMSRRLSTAMRRLVVSEAEDQMRYDLISLIIIRQELYLINYGRLSIEYKW